MASGSKRSQPLHSRAHHPSAFTYHRDCGTDVTLHTPQRVNTFDPAKFIDSNMIRRAQRTNAYSNHPRHILRQLRSRGRTLRPRLGSQRSSEISLRARRSLFFTHLPSAIYALVGLRSICALQIRRFGKSHPIISSHKARRLLQLTINPLQLLKSLPYVVEHGASSMYNLSAELNR